MPLLRLLPDRPVDLSLTLRPLWRGPGDPCMRLLGDRVERAGRSPEGIYAIRIWRPWESSTQGPAGQRIARRDLAGRPGGRADAAEVMAEAWGPGAGWALDALPALLGQADDAAGFEPGRHPVVAVLARRLAGLRIGRSGAVLEALVPAILEQKVTGTEASRAYRALAARYGEPAPGPLGLRLQPAASVLAALPYYAFHPLGVERRRAELIRRVAGDARSLEALPQAPIDDAWTRLQSYPGIGPWTAAEVASRALGDPDAVSVGDFHLPNMVAWALAGEPRADDARMLELLQPWHGQRGRVIRLLEAAGAAAPRFGPRLAPRSIAAL